MKISLKKALKSFPLALTCGPSLIEEAIPGPLSTILEEEALLPTCQFEEVTTGHLES